MNPLELAELVSELRWLVYELGHEMQTLETTAYPLAHRFLMDGLAQRIGRVAAQTTRCLNQPVSTPKACSHIQPVEHPVLHREKGVLSQ